MANNRVWSILQAPITRFGTVKNSDPLTQSAWERGRARTAEAADRQAFKFLQGTAIPGGVVAAFVVDDTAFRVATALIGSFIGYIAVPLGWAVCVAVAGPRNQRDEARANLGIARSEGESLRSQVGRLEGQVHTLNRTVIELRRYEAFYDQKVQEQGMALQRNLLDKVQVAEERIVPSLRSMSDSPPVAEGPLGPSIVAGYYFAIEMAISHLNIWARELAGILTWGGQPDLASEFLAVEWPKESPSAVLNTYDHLRSLVVPPPELTPRLP